MQFSFSSRWPSCYAWLLLGRRNLKTRVLGSAVLSLFLEGTPVVFTVSVLPPATIWKARLSKMFLTPTLLTQKHRAAQWEATRVRLAAENVLSNQLNGELCQMLKGDLQAGIFLLHCLCLQVNAGVIFLNSCRLEYLNVIYYSLFLPF